MDISYTPTTWATGDVVTATKLNKLENGVANAISNDVFLITATDVIDPTTFIKSITLNKTASEIISAINAKCYIVVEHQFSYINGNNYEERTINEYGFVIEASTVIDTDNDASFYVELDSGSKSFYAPTLNDYPYYEDSGAA